MAAPILWAPGIFWVLSAGKPPNKIPHLGEVGVFWKGGVGSADFIFMGAGIFLRLPAFSGASSGAFCSPLRRGA